MQLIIVQGGDRSETFDASENAEQQPRQHKRTFGQLIARLRQ